MAMGPMGLNGSVVAVQFTPVECDEYPQSICLQRVCAIPNHDCEVNSISVIYFFTLLLIFSSISKV